MNNDANLYLLGEIPARYLTDRYSNRTRTVAGQFAYMHNVRLRWLNHSSPELVVDAEPFPRGDQPTKMRLKAALRSSEKLVARFLEDSEAAGRVLKWNGPPATFLGYLIAHEAHLRGLAMVAMRLAGHAPPREMVYGQWQWGKQRNVR